MTPSRRKVVAAAVGVASSSLTGCLAAAGLDDQNGGSPAGGERGVREVIASNGTSSQQTLRIRITGSGGEKVFDHTYELDPGESNQGEAVRGELEGATISLSSPGVGTKTGSFLPRDHPDNPHSDLPPGECEAMDVVGVVDDSGLQITYACP